MGLLAVTKRKIPSRDRNKREHLLRSFRGWRLDGPWAALFWLSARL